jgi:hypothetical protein
VNKNIFGSSPEGTGRMGKLRLRWLEDTEIDLPVLKEKNDHFL